MPLSAPERLADHHDLTRFASGAASLDEWLRRRARGNQVSGASRTFVVSDGPFVVGYYAVSSGGIVVASALGRFRQNMPEPFPIALLGRLAVDRTWQGHGIGRALFRDCAMRVANAADSIGIRGIVVHAISNEARDFYLAIGFEASPIEPMMLMVTLADVLALVR